MSDNRGFDSSLRGVSDWSQGMGKLRARMDLNSNKNVDDFFGDLYSQAQDSYQQNLQNIDSQVAGKFEKQQERHNANLNELNTMQKLLEEAKVSDAKNVSYFQQEVNRLQATINNETVRYSFANQEEYHAFATHMSQAGAFGVGSDNQFNGQYIYQTSRAFAEEANAFEKSQNTMLREYTERQVNSDLYTYEDGQKTYSDNSGNSAWYSLVDDSYMQRVEQDGFSSAMPIVRKIENTVDVLVGSQAVMQRVDDLTSPITHTSIRDKGYGITGESFQTMLENAETAKERVTNFAFNGLSKHEFDNANYTMQTFNDFQSKWGVDLTKPLKMEEINNLNAKMLETLQGKLVYNGQSLIGKDGRIDGFLINKHGITAKDLGISQTEFNLLKNMSGKDSMWIAKNGMFLLKKGVQTASKSEGCNDYGWFYEILDNVDRSKRVFNITKEVRKTTKSLSNYVDSMKKRRDELAKNAKGGKNKLNTTEKKPVTVNNAQKTIDKSKLIEKGRLKEAKRLASKEKFAKSAIGKTAKSLNSARNVVVKKLGLEAFKKGFQAVMGALKKIIFKFIAPAVAGVWLIASVVVIIIMIITSISSFFSEPDLEDTVIYKIYEHLKDEETDWIESCRDMDKLWQNRSKFTYGNHYQFRNMDGATGSGYCRYVNSSKVPHARCEIGAFGVETTYINPFDFEPHSSIANDVEHKITAFDGGKEFQIQTNWNMNLSYTWEDTNGNGMEDEGDTWTPVMGADHFSSGGGHSSNIKDILCMTDVMMKFDMDNSTDGTNSQSLTTDNALGFTAKAFWDDIKNGGKMIGTGIASIFSDDAFASWTETQDNNGNSITYHGLQMYVDGLFHLSHQEQIELEVVFFPIDGSGSGSGGVVEEDESTLNNTNNTVVTSCPGDYLLPNGSHACQYCEEFHFFYTGVAGSEFTHGLLGADNMMHSVGSNVWFEDAPCIASGIEANNYWYNYARNSECWEPYGEYTSTTYLGLESAGGLWKWNTASYTMSKDFIVNSPNSSCWIGKKWYTIGQAVDVTPSGTDTDGDGIIDSYPPVEYKYPVTEHKQGYFWTCTGTCKGHGGYYCGGHLKASVSGFVYSFSDEQIKAVEEGNSLEGKVGDVDYSSMTSAFNTGLNFNFYNDDQGLYGVYDWRWRPNTDYKYPKESLKFMLWEDLFDVDCSICYGYRAFPYAGDFREFESWTADNMFLAISKYNADWNEMYGFDIPTSIGCGSLSEDSIDLIVEGVRDYYGSLTDEREYAIRLALSAVGNGNYSQAHHSHGYLLYPHNGHECNCTDCSGFVSYIFLKTAEDLGTTTNLSGVQSTIGLTTNEHVTSDFSNCQPADALIHYFGAGFAGTGGNHTLLFIGKVSEDIVLPCGDGVGEITIKANMPITVDCTTLNGNGNIYLRNCGTQDECGYPPSSYVQTVDQYLYVRHLK